MAGQWDSETPIGIDTSGFSYDAGALESVEAHLRGAADTLHEATGNQVGSVDAGASTEIVTAAMATLQGLGMISTHVLREAAAKIDAARGSYGEIDNTAEGYIRRQEEITEQMVEDYQR
ncbi:hypothetical protein [Qaidamihabitans albus]|uniref:hypothetical protein n=1 Tax=Qaidamihabitans albus TaxID=2795733 RepID=UPI0018F1104A|nr:hypothetical protein [Qaidamihabitans albus]